MSDRTPTDHSVPGGPDRSSPPGGERLGRGGERARADKARLRSAPSRDIPLLGAVPDPSDLMRSMFEAWFSMFEAVMSSTWGVAKQAGQTIGAAVEPGRADSLGIDVTAGRSADGRLWLKNHSSTTLERVQVRCTTPQNAHGDALAPSSVRCVPDSFDRVLPGANLQIDVQVDVPQSTTPGVYHALILIDPISDTCRPVSIRVSGA